MERFYLEDFDGAWLYVFNVKVEVVLKQWRHHIKYETYDRYSEDWQRFLNLDDRVDELYFTALLMLSLKDNIALTQNLLGLNRIGRYPLRGVRASPGISIRSSIASSMPSTASRAEPGSL